MVIMRAYIGRGARRPASHVFGLAVFAVCAPASAHAAVREFDLPAIPLNVAVIRFGLQAGVTVGGLPVAGCEGRSRAVSGRMEPRDALARLLPPGCDFIVVDPQSFRIVPHRHSPAPVPAPPVPPRDATLEGLVVTAERREDRLAAAPYAVSALSRAELERRDTSTFANLTAEFASVAETNLGPGRDKIFIRGLSDGSFSGRTQSTVGLYLDNLPITYNAPDPDLQLVDLQRLEVLRGPQGTLYGSGSVGGIVRILTAPPDPRARSGFVEGMFGFTQKGAASYGATGVLNLPVFRGAAAIRTVLYTQEAGGYIDNPLLSLKDVNASRRTGLRLAGQAPIADGWRVDLTYVHQSINTADSQYVVAGDGPVSHAAAAREPHDNDFTEIGAGLTRERGKVAAKISLGLITHGLDTAYDATGAFPAAALPGMPIAFNEARRIRLAVLEADFAGSGPGRSSWAAGLFATDSRERQAANLSGGVAPSVYRLRDRLSEVAAYGEADVRLNARTTLSVGARAFAMRASIAGETGGPGRALAPTQPRRRSDAGVAPKVRLAFALGPSRSLYAEVQEGYRAGGFNLPGATPDAAAPGAFRPDHLWNFEAGGVGALAGGRLEVRAAIFHTEWRAIQSDQYLLTGVPFTLNVGDGTNTGVEAEIAWRATPALRLTANVLLNHPQLTRTGPALSAAEDRPLPSVAYQTGGAHLRYERPLAGELRIGLDLEAAYVGRSYLTFEGGPSAAMGDYVTSRLAVDLMARRWQLQLELENLPDNRSNTFAFGNPFIRERQATPIRPRTLRLMLKRSL